MPYNSVNLELDVRNTRYLDHDIKEILQDFSLQKQRISILNLSQKEVKLKTR